MDTNNANQFQDAVSRGILYGFVPCPLAIPERPELNFFPFNVMFARYKTENGKTIMGSAIYEPLLRSYKKEGALCSMEYYNRYNSGSWLIIEYDTLKPSYCGKKFVNGMLIGLTDGKEWKMFFVHFTMLGLSDGEFCEFKELQSKNGN